jgi:ketosteroid isomerase-like protein
MMTKPAMTTKPRKRIGVVKPSDVPPIVGAYLAAIREQNRAILEEILADEFSLTLPQPSIGLTLQRSEAIDFLLTAPTSILKLGSVELAVLAVVQSEDVYAVEFRVKADVCAGGTYDNIYVAWFRLADTKIAYCRQHFDIAYAKSALDAAFAKAVLDRARVS